MPLDIQYVPGSDVGFVRYESNGPLLLMVHAYGMDANSFEHVINAGLVNNFHIISVALPEFPFSPEAFSGKVVGLLKLLGRDREKIFLCGHSLGATVALFIAYHNPALVERIVFLERAANSPHDEIGFHQKLTLLTPEDLKKGKKPVSKHDLQVLISMATFPREVMKKIQAPVLMVVATGEYVEGRGPMLPLERANQTADYLRSCGVRVKVWTVPGNHISCVGPKNGFTTCQPILRFLRRQL